MMLLLAACRLVIVQELAQAGSHEKPYYEHHEKWGRSVPTVKLV